MGWGMETHSPLDPHIQGQCIQLVLNGHGNLKVYIDKAVYRVRNKKKTRCFKSVV